MNYEEGIKIFKGITENSTSIEEITVLNNYIEELITKFSDETISYDEQNLLDTYINYLRDTESFQDLVTKYDNVVYIKNNIRKSEEQIAHEKGNTKVLKLSNPNNGLVLTSVILEVVITLGLITAILILALT